MRAHIRHFLLLDKLAQIATESALMSCLRVNVYRPLEDIAAQDKKHMKCIRIEEIPCPLAEAGEDMVTNQLIYVEVELDFLEYFFPSHGLI